MLWSSICIQGSAVVVRDVLDGAGEGWGGLAEEVRLQADPRQDVFWHTENGIHRFDLLVAEEREARDAKQSVEGIDQIGRAHV